jgi:hypothetical protein
MEMENVSETLATDPTQRLIARQDFTAYSRDDEQFTSWTDIN